MQQQREVVSMKVSTQSTNGAIFFMRLVVVGLRLVECWRMVMAINEILGMCGSYSCDLEPNRWYHGLPVRRIEGFVLRMLPLLFGCVCLRALGEKSRSGKAAALFFRNE